METEGDQAPKRRGPGSAGASNGGAGNRSPLALAGRRGQDLPLDTYAPSWRLRPRSPVEPGRPLEDHALRQRAYQMDAFSMYCACEVRLVRRVEGQRHVARAVDSIDDDARSAFGRGDGLQLDDVAARSGSVHRLGSVPARRVPAEIDERLDTTAAMRRRAKRTSPVPAGGRRARAAPPCIGFEGRIVNVPGGVWRWPSLRPTPLTATAEQVGRQRRGAAATLHPRRLS